MSYVPNFFCFIKYHCKTVTKQKFFLFTHSHQRAGLLQSLFTDEGVENPILWALLGKYSRLRFHPKKIFFSKFGNLRYLLRKITDYFFNFFLQRVRIVKKKFDWQKFLQKKCFFSFRQCLFKGKKEVKFVFLYYFITIKWAHHNGVKKTWNFTEGN